MRLVQNNEYLEHSTGMLEIIALIDIDDCNVIFSLNITLQSLFNLIALKEPLGSINDKKLIVNLFAAGLIL